MPPHGPGVRRAAVWLLWLVCLLSACGPNITAPPEPPQSVRRGDDAFRYKQYGVAIDAYRDYIDQPEQGPYTARVMYKTALAQYRLKEYHQTLATLDALSQRYPKGHWVQVDALRGDSERALGNNMAALQDWEKAWKIANDGDRQKLRPRIVTTAQDLSDVDLAQARRLATDEGFAALLDRQIATRQPPGLAEPIPNAEEGTALEAAETDAASPPPIIEEPTEPVAPAAPVARAPSRQAAAPPEAPVAAPAEVETVLPPDDSAWSPPPPAAAPLPPSAPIEKTVARGAAQIGCLLPLSGSARDLGERAMRGIRLVFAANDKRLVVADTEGDPTVAARRFEELARDTNVLAVIGPLRSKDAESVTRRAEDLQVPALLLSSHESLNGPFSLQFGLTHAGQVHALLDYAMGKIRLRRFGILYPKDAADSAATFRREVERRGGTVVGAVAYPGGGQGPRSDTATVRKWRDRENLQAVFLPDGAAVAGEFARFLQREMPDVTLLGVGNWESLADRDARLNGIVFVDGFYAASERPATRAFVERFQRTYNEAPGSVEVDAYDAATFAERALEKGANSSSEMVSILRALGPVKGAGGDETATADGLMRNVFLLQVSAGRLEEIGESSSHLAEEAPAAQHDAVPRGNATIAAAPAAAAPPQVPPHTTALSEESLPAAAAPPSGQGGVNSTWPEPVAPLPPAGALPANVKVACLLPLSGPDQAYGKRALAGLRLAFADAPSQLIVRDTGGEPGTAADWLARLEDDPEVVAVIGPLRSVEAEIAAPIAERERLPLLLLSQREGLGGRYVLQVAMTRTQQVRLLVHYATGTLKLRRFGIAYPNDTYGSTFAETFKREAANQGASVVGTHPYPPGTTSFASAVLDVRGWQRAGVDALFIPDAAPTATALAVDVRSEMPTIVLLGTESWNDARSLADAGTAVDGAIFADAFFAESTRSTTRDFVERFQQRSGQAPTVFEAQAFDAGLALRKVLAAGATSREQVVAALGALGTFQGAGELRAAPGGFERSVSLLRYHDGRVEEIHTGPTEG